MKTVDDAIEKRDGSFAIDAEKFAAVPDISFDYAIAERTEKAAC